MSDQTTVVYHYTPANEGDHLAGVPARDITVLDLPNLSRAQVRDMTAPSPSGKPMYTASKARNDAAEAARKQQEEAAKRAAAEKEAAEKAAAEEAAKQAAAEEAAKQAAATKNAVQGTVA